MDDAISLRQPHINQNPTEVIAKNQSLTTPGSDPGSFALQTNTLLLSGRGRLRV